MELVDVREGPSAGHPDLSKCYLPCYPDLGSGPKTGRIGVNSQGHQFRVLGMTSKTIQGVGRTRYLVEFLESGFRVEVDSTNTTSGAVIDKYQPRTYGVGVMGGAPRVDTQTAEYKLAAKTWRGMLERCYQPTSQRFSLYGGAGVYVSPRWLVFSQFLADLPLVHGYEEWRSSETNYALDKDFYGSGCYDVSTCVFLPAGDNTTLAQGKPVRTLYNGTEEFWLAVTDFAYAYGLDRVQVARQARGVGSRYPDLEIYGYTPPEGKLLRYKLG